jgi:hypothetical protein
MSLGLSYRQAGWPVNNGWDPQAAKFRILKDHPARHYNPQLRLGRDLAPQLESRAAKKHCRSRCTKDIQRYENPSVLFPSSTCRIALRHLDLPRQRQQLVLHCCNSGGGLGRLP